MYTSHTCATSIRSVAQVEDGKPFLLHKFINCYLILVIGVQVYEFIEQVIQLKNNCQELKLVEQIHILVYQLSIKMSKDDGRQIAWAILPIRESLNACGELVYLFDTGTCSKLRPRYTELVCTYIQHEGITFRSRLFSCDHWKTDLSDSSLSTYFCRWADLGAVA